MKDTKNWHTDYGGNGAGIENSAYGTYTDERVVNEMIRPSLDGVIIIYTWYIYATVKETITIWLIMKLSACYCTWNAYIFEGIISYIEYSTVVRSLFTKVKDLIVV